MSIVVNESVKKRVLQYIEDNKIEYKRTQLFFREALYNLKEKTREIKRGQEHSI